MASDSVKTETFSGLNISQTLKLPYIVNGSPSNYSTLNEFFGVGEIPSDPLSYPDIKYFCIGSGGSRVTTGASNRTAIEVLTHEPTDAVLFEHLPFILVPANTDLAPLERAKYRIRVLEVYDGVEYWAYYLKTFSTVGSVVNTSIVTVVDGSIQPGALAYVPTSARLAPTPVDINNLIYNIANGQHLVTEAVMPVSLSALDVENIINACIIKYGDIKYAMISEVGIVSGYDVPNTVGSDNNGGTVNYTEIKCGQILSFLCTLDPLQDHPDGVTWNCAIAESKPYPPRIA